MKSVKVHMYVRVYVRIDHLNSCFNTYYNGILNILMPPTLRLLLLALNICNDDCVDTRGILLAAIPVTHGWLSARLAFSRLAGSRTNNRSTRSCTQHMVCYHLTQKQIKTQVHIQKRLFQLSPHIFNVEVMNHVQATVEKDMLEDH